MNHLVDELKAKADANIAAMRDAALRARDTHARAELMRHMLMTANKVKDRPVADAVRFIVDHWLEAWDLARASWPHVAEMEAFAAAFHAYAIAPSRRARRRGARDLRPARAGLRRGRDADRRPDGVALDLRAWLVGAGASPPPGKGRPDRDWPAQPFWEHGCLPDCL